MALEFEIEFEGKVMTDALSESVVAIQKELRWSDPFVPRWRAFGTNHPFITPETIGPDDGLIIEFGTDWDLWFEFVPMKLDGFPDAISFTIRGCPDVFLLMLVTIVATCRVTGVCTVTDENRSFTTNEGLTILGDPTVSAETIMRALPSGIDKDGYLTEARRWVTGDISAVRKLWSKSAVYGDSV